MGDNNAGFDLRKEVDSLLRAIERPSYARQGADAVDDLQRLERCVAHLEAVRADLLVEAADPEPRIEEFTVESADGKQCHRPRTVVIEDAVREEIAAALHWSPNLAGSLIGDARQLHAHLPGTLEALRSGAISGRHASVLAEWSGRLSTHDVNEPDAQAAYARMCEAFEERVLRVARRGTVAQTRAAAKRAVTRLDAAGAQRRREHERCTRDVRIVEETDGISVLLARLSTPAAHAVMESVGKEAALIDDESLSVGERRAQALARLVLGGVSPEVRLDVVLPALGSTPQHPLAAPHSDESGDPHDSDDSLAHFVASMVDGFNSATIDDAEVDWAELRDLIADPSVSVTLRKLEVDPVTGVLSGCGRNTYRLPERLREFIVGRDRTCRFPGCARSARASQIDHAEAWDDGGQTDPANLGALCTRHHQLKTHGGWQIDDSRDDGTCSWTSPQGRRYRHRPQSIVEITLQQQFAQVVAAALSSAPVFTPANTPANTPASMTTSADPPEPDRRHEPAPPF